MEKRGPEMEKTGQTGTREARAVLKR